MTFVLPLFCLSAKFLPKIIQVPAVMFPQNAMSYCMLSVCLQLFFPLSVPRPTPEVAL